MVKSKGVVSHRVFSTYLSWNDYQKIINCFDVILISYNVSRIDPRASRKFWKSLFQIFFFFPFVGKLSRKFFIPVTFRFWRSEDRRVLHDECLNFYYFLRLRTHDNIYFFNVAPIFTLVPPRFLVALHCRAYGTLRGCKSKKSKMSR